MFGILMGTNCAHRVADLFLICYKGDFMTSLSDDHMQADIIELLDIYTILLILTILISKE